MNKIIILGGTGFIGRNLVEYFSTKKNFKVTATYFKTIPPKNLKKNVNWIKADLTNTKIIKKILNNQDIVLQFAATTSGSADIVKKPYLHVTDNAVINSLLLRESFESNIKHFVFPSCTVMYQSSKKKIKETDFNESQPLTPTYFGVGNTKIYVEKMCEFYSRISNIKFSVIRHSNLYGPYDKFDLKKSHMMGASITKVLKSKDGIVNVWGTGKEKRDLLYVKDFVNFVDLLIKNQKKSFSLFNVGFGKAFSVNDVINKIIKISKKKLILKHDLSKPHIPTSLCLNSNKAKKEIGWSPKTSLEEGIKKTVYWLNKQT